MTPTILAVIFIIVLAAIRIWRFNEVPNPRSFGASWRIASFALFLEFLWAVFRAANIDTAKNLLLVDVWANGIGFVLLGSASISLAKAFNLFEEEENSSS